jgi:hypothetical protein
MTANSKALILAGLLIATPVAATENTLDCDRLPQAALIEVMTPSAAAPICREVMKVLDGPTIEDIRSFETAAYVFSRKGYKPDRYANITAELVEIIRLRGYYREQDRARWHPTLDIVWKAYEALHGAVSPQDIVVMLRAAGPEVAKGLSDDGLINLIVVYKHLKQEG